METAFTAQQEPLYEVIRGGERATRLVTEAEVRDFLDACGLPEDTPGHEAVLAGATLHIDGADMRFNLIEPASRGLWASLRQRVAAVFRKG